MSFAVQRSFIQIIHDQSRNHWLVISNSSDAATVNVYDSLFHDLSTSSEQQIACIMNTQYNELKVDFIDVQSQSGRDDCGLFAIAFATTLCNGKQPESMFYDQQQMRSHLLSCFEKRVMEQFPIVKKRRIRTKKIVNTQMIDIHCICRMPEISGLPIVSCSDCNTWYHGTICVKVEEEAWKPNTLWYCGNCRT